jgi:hypothetical protein
MYVEDSGRAYSRHHVWASVSEVRTYVFMYGAAKRQVRITLAACRHPILLTDIYLAPHESVLFAAARIIQGFNLRNLEPGDLWRPCTEGSSPWG